MPRIFFFFRDLNFMLTSSASVVPVSRSFFATSFGGGAAGNGVEYWMGYYSSLRPTQMGLSLNIGAIMDSYS